MKVNMEDMREYTEGMSPQEIQEYKHDLENRLADIIERFEAGEQVALHHDEIDALGLSPRMSTKLPPILARLAGRTLTEDDYDEQG